MLTREEQDCARAIEKLPRLIENLTKAVEKLNTLLEKNKITETYKESMDNLATRIEEFNDNFKSPAT